MVNFNFKRAIIYVSFIVALLTIQSANSKNYLKKKVSLNNFEKKLVENHINELSPVATANWISPEQNSNYQNHDVSEILENSNQYKGEEQDQMKGLFK